MITTTGKPKYVEVYYFNLQKYEYFMLPIEDNQSTSIIKYFKQAIKYF